MTNLYGKGTNGKQLWIRTPDGRWAEVPYGAGQDPVIRSVNIWDNKRKKWLVPTWPQSGGTDPSAQANAADKDNLDVRAPGVSWRGESTVTLLPAYNPNYINKVSQQTYKPFHPGWVRFFHCWPKRDPNWRILPFGMEFPERIPNVRINDAPLSQSGRREMVYFWPLGGVKYRTDFTGGTPLVTIGGNTRSDIGLPSNFATASHAGFNTAGFESASNYSRNSNTIDLQAIRERLDDDFPFQGVDYSNQYADIRLMKVKRIYVHGNIEITANAKIDGAHRSNFAGLSWELHMRKGALLAPDPVATEDLGETRYVRYHDDVDGLGDVIADYYYSDFLDEDYFVSEPVDNSENTRLINLFKLFKGVTFTIEDPGEDNVTFWAKALNHISIAGYPQWGTSITFAPTFITIHYAVDGKDTPASTHRWEAIDV